MHFGPFFGQAGKISFATGPKSICYATAKKIALYMTEMTFDLTEVWAFCVITYCGATVSTNKAGMTKTLKTTVTYNNGR